VDVLKSKGNGKSEAEINKAIGEWFRHTGDRIKAENLKEISSPSTE